MAAKKKNLIIVGGGPAGLAAAVAAYDAGERDILILEREPDLGGILNQCIHNGFGLHTFKEELTGPEYAQRYIDEVRKRGIEYKLSATVLDVGRDKKVTYVSSEDGLALLEAKAVILACGCRERPRGAINIAGSRGAGIFSAGTAQKLVNIDGCMPGKEVVILGSGDIGLIMARRMTFEGAVVKAVIELMPYSSGLNRNIVQCLDDFDIPLYFSRTVIDVKGKGRVEGVVTAKVDEKFAPIPGTEEFIPCDTLLLSVGLLPENELAKGAQAKISHLTGGAIVDERMMTSAEGIFECGNMLHVHDLVDFVSAESAGAGKNAAEYIRKGATTTERTPIKCGDGIRYCVPQYVLRGQNGELNLKMRVSGVFKRAELYIDADGARIYSKRKQIAAPGEMESIALPPEIAAKLRGASSIVVGIGVKQ